MRLFKLSHVSLMLSFALAACGTRNENAAPLAIQQQAGCLEFIDTMFLLSISVKELLAIIEETELKLSREQLMRYSQLLPREKKYGHCKEVLLPSPPNCVKHEEPLGALRRYFKELEKVIDERRNGIKQEELVLRGIGERVKQYGYCKYRVISP